MFDWVEFSDLLLRMGIAAAVGGAIGLEREIHARWAGFRTHILVSMGAALFCAAGLEIAPEPSVAATRVVQGIASGIGFLGAGTILKLGDRLEVKGLTTAASIWLAAALGTASGLGLYALAAAGTIVSLAVMGLLRPLEKAFKHRKP